MIDKMNPLYFKGVRPIPVIPTVYTDALSYGEQLGIMGHKTDECVDKVNEIIEDNETFKEEITSQQNTFEDNISEQQSTFEDTMQGQYDQFLEDYQRQFGVVQVKGNSLTDVMSQKAVSDEFDKVVYKPNNSYGQAGQVLESTGNGIIWSDVGAPTDSQVARAVNDWLDDHPEATTTVEDNSLTSAKFTEDLRLHTLKDYITPQMFGAIGDGETDDTQAVQDCLDYALANGKDVVFPKCSGYRCVDPIQMYGNYCVEMLAPIKTEAFIGIIVNDNTQRWSVNHLRLSCINNTNTKDGKTGIQIINSYNGFITIDLIMNFETGFLCHGDNYGFVYNTIFINQINGCKYGIVLRNNTAGWVNENLFIGGDVAVNSDDAYKSTCIGVSIEGNSSHYANANYFLKPCLEGLYKGISIDYGSLNTFEAARLELTSIGVTISGGQSPYNKVTFTGTNSTVYTDTSSGVYNTVERVNNPMVNLKELYCCDDLASICYSNATEIYCGRKICKYDRTSGEPIPLGRCYKTKTGIVFTGTEQLGVFVDTTNCKKFYIGNTDTNVRRFCVCYDANGNVIDNTTYSVMGARYDTIQTGVYAWIIGGSSTVGSLFVVPNVCAKMFVGFYGLSSINVFKLYGEAEANVLDNKLAVGLSSIPTCEAYDGETCVDKADNTHYGWKCINNTWASI